MGPETVSLEVSQEAAAAQTHGAGDSVQIRSASFDPLLRLQDGHVKNAYAQSVVLSMMGQPGGHLLASGRGGEVPNMAQQPSKKRPFVPSQQDHRRASEFRRKAEEIGQPALAKIVGVSVRTLQRQMDLERAMPAYVVDRFERQFGKIDFPSPEKPRPLLVPQADPAANPSAIDRVLLRYADVLSYAQVQRLRVIEASGPTLNEEQWEQLVSAVLNTRQVSP